MVTLDQVVLLQKKVEAAVEKIRSLDEEIQQLCSENDALRSKCAELTNALKDKTELASSFEAEQNQIEENILKALSQLDAVEDSILYSTPDVDSQENLSSEEYKEELEIEVPVQQQVQGQNLFNEKTESNVVVNTPATEPSAVPVQKIQDPLASAHVEPRTEVPNPAENQIPSNVSGEQDLQFESSDEKSDGNQFDIF